MTNVEDFLRALEQFPRDWAVIVDSRAGGPLVAEHRFVKGKSVVAIFGSNGGRFGENPESDEEYARQCADFIDLRKRGYLYTSSHGDHRLYKGCWPDASCYGHRFDSWAIERMVSEGLISKDSVDIERVNYFNS